MRATSLSRDVSRRDLALAALVIALFGAAVGHDFALIDDVDIVTANRYAPRGLTVEGVRWSFLTNAVASWLPLTWLSHMLDVQLFGLDPAGHHAVSVLSHAANAVLVFALLRAATGAFWGSGLVAVLFAIHPLRVESVVWVSERKDVLSVFFSLLCLLAKQMSVTLPIVFLLLDWWPLGRLSRTVRVPGGNPALPAWRDAARRVAEKLPLLGIAIAAVWLAGDILRMRPGLAPWLAAGCALFLGFLAALTWRQGGYWRSDIVFFERAVSLDPGN